MRYLLRVYRTDCILTRKYQYKPSPPCSVRETITEFSYKSRRRLAFVANNTDVRFKSMITLTYPSEYPGDGKEVKRHLRNMIRYLRHNVQAVSYLWFLEFQRRGAPHIHMLLDCALSALPGKKDISIAWARIVDSGDDKHLKAGTRTETLRTDDGGARYATKYAMKMYQKDVPEKFQNVGRFWGHSTDVKPKCKGMRGYFYFEDLQKDLARWPYKKHLANPKVATLYNAAKEISNDKIEPRSNGKGHSAAIPHRIYDVVFGLVDAGNFHPGDRILRRIRWRHKFVTRSGRGAAVLAGLHPGDNVPGTAMATHESTNPHPPTPQKPHQAH